MRDYETIKIPKDLIELVDQVVASGKYGYRSRMEFVIDAVRRRLEQLGYLK